MATGNAISEATNCPDVVDYIAADVETYESSMETQDTPLCRLKQVSANVVKLFKRIVF